MRAGWTRVADCHWASRVLNGHGTGFCYQPKADLAAAGEFDIDLG
jgi:hypothetical protein